MLPSLVILWTSWAMFTATTESKYCEKLAHLPVNLPINADPSLDMEQQYLCCVIWCTLCVDV